MSNPGPVQRVTYPENTSMENSSNNSNANYCHEFPNQTEVAVYSYGSSEDSQVNHQLLTNITVPATTDEERAACLAHRYFDEPTGSHCLSCVCGLLFTKEYFGRIDYGDVGAQVESAIKFDPKTGTMVSTKQTYAFGGNLDPDESPSFKPFKISPVWDRLPTEVQDFIKMEAAKFDGWVIEQVPDPLDHVESPNLVSMNTTGDTSETSQETEGMLILTTPTNSIAIEESSQLPGFQDTFPLNTESFTISKTTPDTSLDEADTFNFIIHDSINDPISNLSSKTLKEYSQALESIVKQYVDQNDTQIVSNPRSDGSESIEYQTSFMDPSNQLHMLSSQPFETNSYQLSISPQKQTSTEFPSPTNSQSYTYLVNCQPSGFESSTDSNSISQNSIYANHRTSSTVALNDSNKLLQVENFQPSQNHPSCSFYFSPQRIASTIPITSNNYSAHYLKNKGPINKSFMPQNSNAQNNQPGMISVESPYYNTLNTLQKNHNIKKNISNRSKFSVSSIQKRKTDSGHPFPITSISTNPLMSYSDNLLPYTYNSSALPNPKSRKKRPASIRTSRRARERIAANNFIQIDASALEPFLNNPQPGQSITVKKSRARKKPLVLIRTKNESADLNVPNTMVQPDSTTTQPDNHPNSNIKLGCILRRVRTKPTKCEASENKSKLKFGHICTNCGNDKTVFWRKDATGNYMCNSCALYMKKHKIPRSLELAKKHSVPNTRNRRPKR